MHKKMYHLSLLFANKHTVVWKMWRILIFVVASIFLSVVLATEVVICCEEGGRYCADDNLKLNLRLVLGPTWQCKALQSIGLCNGLKSESLQVTFVKKDDDPGQQPVTRGPFTNMVLLKA